MAKKDETELQESDVQREKLAEVHIGRHWAYLFGVLIGSFLLMVGLIAILGSSVQG